MGAWGPGPFDNDAAVDWLVDTTAIGPRSVQKALSGLRRDTDQEAAAVAAAAIVGAAIAGEGAMDPGAVATGERNEWVALAPIADARLSSILEQSELAELWREAGEFESWAHSLRDIKRWLSVP